MNKLILRLTKREYIEWSASIAVEKLGWFDKALITLCVKNKRYVLYDREISDCLYCLRICLQEALYNRYPLNPVPKQDIGYLHNEDLSLPLDQWDSTLWKWEKNLLWVAAGRQPYLETWLYNDTQGNIIMHVTEIYYWLDFDKSKGKNYITYNEFMKNYKPTFSCIIPHQTARQWLAQCEYLLATVKENEARDTLEHDLARANGTCKQCLEKEKLERELDKPF